MDWIDPCYSTVDCIAVGFLAMFQIVLTVGCVLTMGSIIVTMIHKISQPSNPDA